MRTLSILSRTGFTLGLAVGLVVPILLLVFSAAASPFTGAAIDSYDSNILEPAERATLNSIASAMGLTLLAGTVLGITALALGMLTRRSGGLATATIVLACVAPVVALFISFWTLAAAASPDYIAG
ncbi:MAG: hypothetical protein EPO52_06210 [Herbiconiux sp.]|uniref:hypothetical protein n=1 Tax=Herbiconiux sp. TaxID=1871186 RepID=UPI0012168A8C|nr:hypothetical protein [Herbiconiux sp.]TAJ48817.1 MAG: hypothetical protein EPO52_06210 [Herbiconiux sp.]